MGITKAKASDNARNCSGKQNDQSLQAHYSMKRTFRMDRHQQRSRPGKPPLKVRDSDWGLRTGRAFQATGWEMALDVSLWKVNLLFQAKESNRKVSEWGIKVAKT